MTFPAQSLLCTDSVEGLGLQFYANGHADCREARHLTTKRDANYELPQVSHRLPVCGHGDGPRVTVLGTSYDYDINPALPIIRDIP